MPTEKDMSTGAILNRMLYLPTMEESKRGREVASYQEPIRKRTCDHCGKPITKKPS